MDCRERSAFIRFWRWVRPIVFCVIVLSAMRSSLADWNDVPTGSMQPSILVGDRIFVNKLAYDLKVPFTLWRAASWSDPQRGDVVVCFSPADGKRLVKRIIGLPGDVIEMRHNCLLVNAEPAAYEAIDAATAERLGIEPSDRGGLMMETVAGFSHPVRFTTRTRARRSFGPTTVPQGAYFVMGDNRDRSFDSRYFGAVPMSDIVGRANCVVISFDHDNWHLPRANRFFRPLP